jgi:hypothetical protein
MKGRAGARVTSLTEAHVSLSRRRPRPVAAGTLPYILIVMNVYNFLYGYARRRAGPEQPTSRRIASPESQVFLSEPLKVIPLRFPAYAG